MTDVARERRALALFDLAIDLPAGERDALVEREAAGDAGLRARLISLLNAERRAQLATGGALNSASNEPPVPERVGAYRLTGLIAHGGMGAVYRGERDVDDFAHSVAVKVIRAGLLTEALRDRFRRERQTLAQLSHPNIAQLFDGGEVDGAPYIIMELVDGAPLGQWVEEHAPDLAVRLGLFDTICRAVGFAHRNLIVHRDLTPSNVLVTRDGVVKLIDFGIARAPDPAEEGGATPPSITSLSLTPGYAAPERMTSAHVSTAADIFSLGRLLAWLLPRRDFELEAVFKRATAPAPEKRYASAEALADDVKAWADGRPVGAVAGGRRYRAAKVARRHVGAIAVTAMAIVLLVGATAYSVAANQRAQGARAEAERRFDEVRALANTMLFDLNDRFARVPGNTAARAALADRAQHYLERLASARDSSAALRLDTARGFIRLAQVQGVPLAPNLGDRIKAKANLARARTVLATLPPTDPGAMTLRGAAAAREALIAAHGDTDHERARVLLTVTRRTLDAVPVAARDTAWMEARRVLHLAALEEADLAGERARFPALIAVARDERAGWPDTPELRADAATLDYFAALTMAETDGASALAAHERLATRFDRLLTERPDEPVLLYRAAWNLTDGFAAGSRVGQEARADRLIRRAVATVDRLAAIDDRDDSVSALQAIVHEGFAQNLRDHDRFKEALTSQAKVIAIRRRALDAPATGRQLGNLGFSEMIYGIIARDGADRTAACLSWRRAAETLKRAQGTGTIAGFHAGFLPGITSHLAACGSGGKIDGPMMP